MNKELKDTLKQIKLITFKGFASNDAKILARTLADIRGLCEEKLNDICP